MKVETVPIDKLIPYARNSRTHSDAQVAQVAASIREFGFTNPVLIDAEDGIIAGHGRVLAARKLGLDVLPCIRLAHLSETQKRAYVIADNQLALNSGWDEEMLSLELAELRNLNFDVAITGFDDDFTKLEENDEEPDVSEKKIGELFEVIAECENEDQQNMVFNLLNEREIKCRLSVL